LFLSRHLLSSESASIVQLFADKLNRLITFPPESTQTLASSGI
jgi:hypothetical protein